MPQNRPMPYLKIETNKVVSDLEAADLKQELEQVMVDVMSKPLKRVMISIAQAEMNFGGSNEACAYAQLQSLGGLNKEVNDELSIKISAALTKVLHIPAERIFVNFIHFERDHWGGNEGSFA